MKAGSNGCGGVEIWLFQETYIQCKLSMLGHSQLQAQRLVVLIQQLYDTIFVFVP